LQSSKFKNIVRKPEKLKRQKCILALKQNWCETNDVKTEKQNHIIFKVWNCLAKAYCQLQNYVFGLLSISAQIYCCDQFYGQQGEKSTDRCTSSVK
jgi:hypothetical protein